MNKLFSRSGGELKRYQLNSGTIGHEDGDQTQTFYFSGLSIKKGDFICFEGVIRVQNGSYASSTSLQSTPTGFTKVSNNLYQAASDITNFSFVAKSYIYDYGSAKTCYAVVSRISGGGN